MSISCQRLKISSSVTGCDVVQRCASGESSRAPQPLDTNLNPSFDLLVGISDRIFNCNFSGSKLHRLVAAIGTGLCIKRTLVSTADQFFFFELCTFSGDGLLQHSLSRLRQSLHHWWSASLAELHCRRLLTRVLATPQKKQSSYTSD